MCEKEGDILLFLTGEQEIEDAVKKLQEETKKTEAEHGPTLVVPLYSTLPPKQQQRIFDPAPKALTPGVYHVIVWILCAGSLWRSCDRWSSWKKSHCVYQHR